MVGGSPVVSPLLQDEPTIEVLQLLGMDVGVPGNHDFDEGVTEMLRLQRGGEHKATGYFGGAGFPFILANVVDKATQNPILTPYVIRVVGGVPIGFIGVVSLETPTIVMPSGVANVSFIDPVAAINKYAKVLQSKGVQTIVVLAHEGGAQKAGADITGPIRSIAEQVDDSVDVIVSGHTHTVLNGKVDGKLIVQAGQYGANFADVDLVIDKASGDVVQSKGSIVPVVSVKRRLMR
jgi:5'-nucleotidase